MIIHSKSLENSIFILILYVTLFSAYIGSWFPGLGVPSGALLRDSLIIIFIVLMILNDRKTIKIDLYKSNILIVYSLLVLWVLILFMHAPSFIQAIMGSRIYILYPLFAIALIYSNYFYSNRNEIRKHLLLIFFIATVISLIDYISSGTFSTFLGYHKENLYKNFTAIDSYEGHQRLNAGFADALNFAYFLVIGLIFCLYNMINNKFYKLSVILLILIIFASFFTLTRGAIFTEILVLSLYIVLNFTKKRFLWAFLPIIILIVISFFVFLYLHPGFLGLVLSRIFDSSEASHASTQGRIIMAINSLNYLSEHPLLGAGLGTQGTGNLLSNTSRVVDTDNYFFIVALEIGVFGFFLNMVLSVLLFFYYVKNNLKVSFSFISLMLLYFISALLSSSLSSPLVILYFYILFLFTSKIEVDSISRTVKMTT